MIEAFVMCAVLAQPMDMADWTHKMIGAQPPPVVATEDDPAYFWFVYTEVGGPGYMTLIMHTTRVCCYEVYVDEESAGDYGYVGWEPMDFFEGEDMSYRILDVPPDHPWYDCNGQGQAIGSYPLGEMHDAYTGPLGKFDGTGPLILESRQDCLDFIEEQVYVWSGLEPAILVPLEYWFTCPGDWNGDGTVSNLDVLYLLARWDPFSVGHFLETIANWGDCPE